MLFQGEWNMWPLPRITNHSATFIIHPQHLICSWFIKTQDKIPYYLNKYQRIPLDTTIVYRGRVYNPTALGSLMTNFLQDNNIPNAYVAVALDSVGVTENIMSLHTQDQPNSCALKKMVWDTCPLYTDDNGKQIIYICALLREQIAQYTTLATRFNLNLVTLTTPTLCALTVYKKIHQQTFRQSTLAYDMKRHNNNIMNYFSRDIVQRLIKTHTPTIISSQELPNIVTVFGLFLQGHHYETNQLY